MIEESLILEQNQYDLFYNILLSVKSKNPHVRMETDEKNAKCKLETGNISTNSGQSSAVLRLIEKKYHVCFQRMLINITFL